MCTGYKWIEKAAAEFLVVSEISRVCIDEVMGPNQTEEWLDGWVGISSGVGCLNRRD